MNSEYKSLINNVYDHADALVKASDAAGNYAMARLKAGQAGVEVPTP